MCLKNLSQSLITRKKFACHFLSSLCQLPRLRLGKSSGQVLNRRVSHQERMQDGAGKQSIRGSQRWVPIYFCQAVPALRTSVSSHVEWQCFKNSRMRPGLYNVISRAQEKPQKGETSLYQKLRLSPW